MLKLSETILKRQLGSAPKSIQLCRYVNTVPDPVLEKTRTSKLGLAIKAPGVEEEPKKEQVKYIEAFRDYKFVYPDFLPDPTHYFRDKVREKLERFDMISRRKQLNVPEFYVGSIMAVSVADPYAPGKLNRFVGICIRRDGFGLRHNFTLRNVVDGLGIEIAYDLYNPTIQKIEVLKLEKRLDDNLTYLQDCPPEYSTIPFDMEPVRLPPGMTVPLNTIKVPLKPRPWRFKWERRQMRGLIYPESNRYENEKLRNSSADFRPYDKYDLMKQYRESIDDEDHTEIVKDLKKYEKDVESRQEIIQSAKKLTRVRQVPKEQV